MKKTVGMMVLSSVTICLAPVSQAAVVTWDGGSVEGPRWHLAENWNPDTAPSGLSGSTNDFVFTGADIQAFGVAVEMKSLTAVSNATIRVRNASAQLIGDMNLSGIPGAGTKLWNADASAWELVATNGTCTFGGTFQFDVQQAAGTLTLDLGAVAFQAGSTITKIRDGALVFDAESLAANGNTFAVVAGSLQLGGTADYSGLSLNIASGAALIVSNSISLAELVVGGIAIQAGTYSSGDGVFGDYPELVDGGGTLTVLATASASTVFWDGGSASGPRWHLAENWNPDTAPSGLGGSTNHFDFTGNSIEAFGTAVDMGSLTGGDSSVLRIRNSASVLNGNLILTGTVGNGSKLYVADAQSLALTVNGTATFGGSGLNFDVQQSGGTMTLNLDEAVFQSGSGIKKIRAGALVFNAESLAANSNTFSVAEGSLQLGGAADYSGLGIDIASGAELVVSNSIALASLTLGGTEINDGSYASGDAIFTTYAELVDGGGTLVVGDTPKTYSIWLDDYPTLGASTNFSDDADGDGLNNLLEYALGGNPTNDDFAAVVPASLTGIEGGTNWLYYIYRRRLDAVERNLSYEVVSGTDLVFDPMTNLVEEVSVAAIDAEFESVTNRLAMDEANQAFMKLNVELSQ